MHALVADQTPNDLTSLSPPLVMSKSFYLVDAREWNRFTFDSYVPQVLKEFHAIYR
jgi:hypothetical protein